MKTTYLCVGFTWKCDESKAKDPVRLHSVRVFALVTRNLKSLPVVPVSLMGQGRVYACLDSLPVVVSMKTMCGLLCFALPGLESAVVNPVLL